MLAGITLLIAGILVLLLSVPGWAVEALLGVALIAAGVILLRLDGERR